MDSDSMCAWIEDMVKDERKAHADYMAKARKIDTVEYGSMDLVLESIARDEQKHGDLLTKAAVVMRCK